MAYTNNISRLARLTAILIKLQSRTYTSVAHLAEVYKVSSRTIYRDLGSLEEAGVPLIFREGKGYSIIEGYNMPPVMFTEGEANAIIFADKLISKTKDESLIAEFKSAIDKIKSVLRTDEKEKADFLAERTIIGKNWHEERTSTFLSDVQKALTNYEQLEITYLKKDAKKVSKRIIEPFALYFNVKEYWVVTAFCQKSQDFRSFRLDRIQTLHNTAVKFEAHKMTLEEYGERQYKEYLKNKE